MPPCRPFSPRSRAWPPPARDPRSSSPHWASSARDPWRTWSPRCRKNPAPCTSRGADLLSSLFGSSTISGIVNALSRFANIAPGVTQKLLGYLTPLILGTIASKFTGKSMNAQGLASMFADQKASIASALPSGFSLSDVPGLAAAGSAAARSAARGVEAAGSSLPRWLLPLLGLAALGLLLWWFIPSATTQAPEASGSDGHPGAVSRDPPGGCS